MTNLYHKLKGLFQSKKTITYTGTSITDKELLGTPAWGINSSVTSPMAYTGVCCYGDASAVCAYKDSRGILYETKEEVEKAEKRFLWTKARDSYYTELNKNYLNFYTFSNDPKSLKDLIDATQKYYDLCTDIS